MYAYILAKIKYVDLKVPFSRVQSFGARVMRGAYVYQIFCYFEPTALFRLFATKALVSLELPFMNLIYLYSSYILCLFGIFYRYIKMKPTVFDHVLVCIH